MMKYFLVALLATFVWRRGRFRPDAQRQHHRLSARPAEPCGRRRRRQGASGDATYTSTTDPLGEFRFLNLPAGPL